MKKIFCDRCKKVIDVDREAEKAIMDGKPFYNITKITYTNEWKKVKTKIDLCFNCQKEVFNWYENNKSNSNS